MNRRYLLGIAAASAVAFQDNALERVRAASTAAGARTPEEIAVDEDFWAEVRAAFSIDRNITDGAVYLPCCGVLAWIDPTAKPLASGGTEIDRTRSYVYFASARAGESFQFRGLKFIPGAESCGEDTPPSASNQGQIKRE